MTFAVRTSIASKKWEPRTVESLNKEFSIVSSSCHVCRDILSQIASLILLWSTVGWGSLTQFTVQWGRERRIGSWTAGALVFLFVNRTNEASFCKCFWALWSVLNLFGQFSSYAHESTSWILLRGVVMRKIAEVKAISINWNKLL